MKRLISTAALLLVALGVSACGEDTTLTGSGGSCATAGWRA